MKPEPKNQAAAALARLGRGVPKTLTPAQRRQRREQLAAVRHKRHPKPAQPPGGQP